MWIKGENGMWVGRGEAFKTRSGLGVSLQYTLGSGRKGEMIMVLGKEKGNGGERRQKRRCRKRKGEDSRK